MTLLESQAREVDATLYGTLGRLFDDEPTECEVPTIGLAEKVYRCVVNRIRSGEFPSESKLTQRGLSSALDVSQVTVREAFERLAQQGWIERSPNRGVCVRSFSNQDREEIYGIREMIEAQAVRKVAQSITEEQLEKLKEVADLLSLACKTNDVKLYEQADIQFHRLIVFFVGNKRLQEYYETILRQIRCFLMVGAMKVAFHWAESCEILEPCSHDKVYEAIASGNHDLAEKLIRKHISFTNEMLQMIQRTREL